MGTPIKPKNNPKSKASYAMLPPQQPITPQTKPSQSKSSKPNKQKTIITQPIRFTLLDGESVSSSPPKDHQPPKNYQQALTIPPSYSPSPSKPTNINPTFQYIEKDITQSICIVEPEYWGQTMQETLSKILPPDLFYS